MGLSGSANPRFCGRQRANPVVPGRCGHDGDGLVDGDQRQRQDLCAHIRQPVWHGVPAIRAAAMAVGA